MTTTTTTTAAKTMTTTTTDRSSHQRERLSGGRAVLAVASFLAVVAVGCTTSGSDATTTTAVQAGQGSTTSTHADTPGSTLPAPGDLLDAALVSYGDGYQFEASVTVGDQEAATIEGIVAGDDAMMTVTSGDGIATYVLTPTASWVRVDNGDWQEVESDGPFERPLAQLASPSSISIAASNDSSIDAVAVYDGSVFGTDDSVDMGLRFVDGLLARATYTTTEASVTTTFGPLDGASVEIPSAAP